MANELTAKNRLYIRKLVYSALFLALAYVLPFVTGQIPQIGAMLCPMHIPVLLCGYVCGWSWGLGVGLIVPLLRSFTLGMPPLFPSAVGMACELAAYGALAGIKYRLLPKKPWGIYASLLIAMIGGRIVWGLVRFLLAGAAHTEFPFAAFVSGAVTSAVPGIIVQIVLVPMLVLVLRRAKLTLNE